ncbi:MULTISPECIES: dual specificity protein phosphatase family protein [unclassified Streptomyces]|uniref:dual specificity protein phosphatase family protein n=1 Tax=unclassified Streptomyces TaxID=2593676 RepID=UPI000DC7ED01|nr:MULTISPECIES: dual specificity protein phosphatase family protein [unclassified Streptomyces]AWZ09667.1 protein phosphatase [Streptomyces sp. ICC4]AWZ17573.1 protein phosphatase [Streptomyces sp. ICC1]
MRKTRQRDRDAPGPQSPWDEIVPGLWMGGHHWTDPAGEPWPVVAGSEFDLVISLFTRPGHGPDAGVEHLVGEVPDGPLTGAQLRTVQRLAGAARAALDSGRTILVRCHCGYNRSGLVVAQCLIDGGLTPDAAIGLVRRKRSAWALGNGAFTAYLAAGLDTAALLVDLDPASGAAPGP